MGPSLKTSQDVVDFMSAATSESDWNERCDKVKDAFNGYPDFWFSDIILNGVLATTRAKW
jgi:hypothetical protein